MRVQALSRRMEQLLEAVDVQEDMTEPYMLVMAAMEYQLEHPELLEDLRYMSLGHEAPMTLVELASSHHSSRPR